MPKLCLGLVTKSPYTCFISLYVNICAKVGIGGDLSLYALRPGRIMISREKLTPKPDSQLKPATDAGEAFYKYFFHVIPIDPQPGLFRLTSLT